MLFYDFLLMAAKDSPRRFHRYLSVAAKLSRAAAQPGGTPKSLQTGQPNVPLPAAKATRVIRAADLSSKTYLETEADVDTYIAKLKDELLPLFAPGKLPACNSLENISRSGYFGQRRAAND